MPAPLVTSLSRHRSIGTKGESFFFAVAGLSLSLAGFAALIASLRGESRTWDPITFGE
ncbi:MAG: hypothetical protein ACR2ME_10805 [Acidimicrobiia bacterium]